MGAKLIQPSFAGGELSPQLYGRVDLGRYGTSVKTAKNFIVRPYGGLANRAGLQYIGEVKTSATATRLIPFEFSTEVAYIIELGNLYMRFWANGAPVERVATITGVTQANPAVVTAAGHGFVAGQSVRIAGVVGMTQLNGNTYTVANPTASTFELSATDSTGFTAYGSAGTATSVVEVVTPWATADLPDVRFTQSADAMWFVHPDYPPHLLQRTSSTSFVLSEYETREGPFGSLNTNEAITLSASGRTGVVTVTSTGSTFTADMVGSLLYIEAKTLGQVKPWTQGDRGVALGDLCRSDGKTYLAVTVPVGSDWTETGSFRPIHEYGRAWDGRGDDDVRTNGTQTWKVGIEWEYQDSGFGIVLITGYTNATTVTGIVQKNLPAQVVGGLGLPIATWTFSGDGSTTLFSVTGATSSSALDYIVTVDGEPVQSNPYYTPPPGSGGGVVIGDNNTIDP